MLDNNIYLTASPYASMDPKEAEREIAKNLGIRVKNAADLLLVLNAYTLFMSHEELRALLPSLSYNNRINKLAIPQLKKAGYIDRISLKSPVGTSKCLFEITKQGEGAARRIKGGAITVKRPKKFQKDKAQAYEDKLSHPYSAGFNLFQLLLLQEPFEWEREVPYGSGYEFKQNRSDFLQVDARCFLYPKNAKKARCLFIEQDMGTETNRVLMEKLEKYNNYSLMADKDNLIVFSFYQKEASISLDHKGLSVFSNARCRALSDFMEVYNYDLVDEVLASDYKDKDYARALKEFVEAENAKYGEKEVVTASFVEDFAQTLALHENPYMLRSFNMEHLALTKRRLYGIAKALMTFAYQPPLFFDRIAEGFVVSAIPTCLLANRLPFAMLSKFDEAKSRVEETVLRYFPKASFTGEVSDPVPVKTGTSVSMIRLRNAFTYPTQSGKGYVFVEMPFMDAGSWLRLKLLTDAYAGRDPVSVICVVEDEEQARQLFSAINYEHNDFEVPLDLEGINGIYGIFLKDLGGEIFAPSGPEEFFTIY